MIRARELGMVLSTLALLVGVAALIAAQAGVFKPAPRHYAPWPVVADPDARVAVGVVTDRLAGNWAQPWQAADLQQVNRFEQLSHKHAEIVMYFADWAHSRFDMAQLQAIAARNSVPEIAWEPWNASRGPYRGIRQPRYTLASIIDGSHDAYIWSWARGLARFGRPVLLRFAQEMNLRAYPWSEFNNGNRPGQFVAAWRHVHDIFAQAGAGNVRWVWSPSAKYLDRAPYPGSAYVDVLALTGFNGGTLPDWGGWKSFAGVFDSSLSSLHAIDPAKPVQISEIGSAEAGGDKAAWLRAAFADLASKPFVTSVVWFDLNKESQWEIDSSPAALRAFQAGVGNSRYGQVPAP